MKKIAVAYYAAKNQYTPNYECLNVNTEVSIDAGVANALVRSRSPSNPLDENILLLESMLESLESLRHRTYLRGSIQSIQIMEDETHD